MAERPVFVPTPDGVDLVDTRSFGMHWHAGFALVQKQRNIRSLHEAAAKFGYKPLLEISTKSEDALGRELSAFNVKVRTANRGEIPLECAFQGGKVFERGGPYTDLYGAEPRDAKRDLRLQSSGRLVAFEFEGHRMPLVPRTAFYDWLYINAILRQPDRLTPLLEYAGFTDIEFNPERSINCQARSCALFVALGKANLLDEAMKSEAAFINTVGHY